MYLYRDLPQVFRQHRLESANQAFLLLSLAAAAWLASLYYILTATKPIDVRSPVKKGVEIATSRYGINGKVELETSLPSNLPRVLGDEAALAEAFAHLVANAAEASADRNKPRITLSGENSPGRTTFRRGGCNHADNGLGISPKIKEKIFSPFCTTKPRGMGLGLPIVKRTVFDHHGRVEVDSTSKGTQVSVVLPATSGQG